VPSVPKTPYTPSDAVHTPYPFSLSAAASLLRSHGWKVVPNGQTTCAKAGTGPGACGAGIPAGTPFKFTWYYIPAAESPSIGLESESLASEAKQVGIDIELQTKTFNFLFSTYNDANPADSKYTNDWGVENFGGFTDDYYPTTFSIFNTGGDYNQGAYNSAMADALIDHSLFSSNPKAVTSEASFLTKDVPILFMPNSDYIYAVSKSVGGTASSWLALTQFSLLPQDWYLTKP
jgi:peptide/nickel transport system substrate-binding protein